MAKMEEDAYPDLDKICRLCLQKDLVSPVQIFPTENSSGPSLPMRIMACAALEIQSSDNLPKQMCIECRLQLEKSYYFRKRSQLADSKLRKHVKLQMLGKRSRIFSMTEEEALEDELEFEDSLCFLKADDEQRSKKAQEERAAWEKEYKESLKVLLQEEVRAELRPLLEDEVRRELVVQVRQELKAEMSQELVAERDKMVDECIAEAKSELRQEVTAECREEEMKGLLKELEDFLKQKRVAVEESSKAEPSNAKRKRESPQDGNRKTFKRQARASTVNKRLQNEPALEDDGQFATRAEAEELNEAEQSLAAYEQALSSEEDFTNEDAETEQNFYILETTENNEQEDVAAPEAEAQDQDSQEVTLLSTKIERTNFQLNASENARNKKRQTTSYHIGSSGEIFKKETGKTDCLEEEHVVYEDEVQCEEADLNSDVIVYNIDASNTTGSVSLLPCDQKIILSMNSEAVSNIPDYDEQSIVEDTALIAKNTGATQSKATTTTTTTIVATKTVGEVHPIQRTTDTAKSFHCDFCPMLFSTENSMNRHLRTHRRMDERGVAFQCPECHIFVSCRSALSRHVLIHSGKRPYVCEDCGKGFVQREILKRHQQIHTGERPHKCTQCDRAFSQKANLNEHVNRCHSDEPKVMQHACHLCPKRFNHASGLSRHLASHNGVTYQCTNCKRNFGDRSSVKRHIMNVHGAKVIANDQQLVTTIQQQSEAIEVAEEESLSEFIM